MRKFSFLLLFFCWPTGVNAQVDCQGIMNQLLSGMGGPGVYSGGAENLANIYNTYCLGGQRQYQPPQQQVGDYCANGITCPVGSRCSVMPGRCVPNGTVDCGAYYCQPGNKCGSAGGCISEATVDCGRGQYCSTDSICWTARGNWPGVVKRGDVSCASPEQALQWDKKIAELEAERRQKLNDEREAKRREAQEKREAAKRKAEEKREAAKQKQRDKEAAEAARKLVAKQAKEARKTEAARKQAAAVEAKKQAARARIAAAEAARKSAADAKVAAEKLAAEKALAAKVAAEKAAADKAAALKVAADKAASDRLRAQAAADRAAAEKLAAKAAADKAAADKILAMKTASDKAVADKAAAQIATKQAAADKNTATTRPYLGAGQQAIDKAFSPEAQKAIGANPGAQTRPYLGTGQQAIDKAFSPEANPANRLPSPGTGQQTAAAAINRPLSLSRADNFLRTVANDSSRPQSERETAARALNDTPTFREIAAIGLGKKPEPSGRTATADSPPAAPLTAGEIKLLRDSAVVLAPSRPISQPAQSADLWRKLETNAQTSAATQKPPGSVQVAKGIENLSQRSSTSTFSTQPATGQVTLTPKLSNDERLATAKIEAQQQAALHGLSIDRGTAIRVLPYARLSQDAYSDKSGNTEVPNMRRVSDWETILKSGGYSDREVAAFKRSGFSAAVYRNDKTGEIVIAYRGTEPRSILGADGMTDLDSSIAGTLRNLNPNYVSGQYQAAADLAQVVKQKWPSGTTVTLTGHSLGGGLASYAGSQNNIPSVITFNAARNTFSTSAVNDKQINIAVPGELIGDANTTSGFGKGALPGQLYSVPSTKDRPGLVGDLLGAHGMDGLIGGLENSAQ